MLGVVRRNGYNMMTRESDGRFREFQVVYAFAYMRLADDALR